MANSVLYIIAFLFAAYVAICLFYFLFQERFIFVPLWRPRRKAKLALVSPYQEVFLDGEEGGRLHAIHIRAKNPRGCILYFHGNTGNIVRWAPIAQEFTSFGFDVILPDYRGYGKSTGKRTEELLYADALLWYGKATETFAEHQICIYGRSLGSSCATWLLGRTSPGAGVLETPFDNFIHVAQHYAKIIPAKWFLRFTFRNDIHIRRCRSPLLISHGTKDKIVPYILGFQLYEIAKNHTRAHMVTIPGGRHSNLNGYPLFRDKLNEFFDLHFPRTAEADGEIKIPLKRI